MAASAPQLQCPGLTVHLEVNVPAAALRYFSREGVFANRLRAAGLTLPDSGCAVEPERHLILAWRSPSETLCLARDEARLAQLKEAVGAQSDGCLVELTGALTVLHPAGPRIGELLARLGGSASLADVPVLALCVADDEVPLVVERTYAEHLLGWIRETLLDFE
jgi:hypothetical protein